MASWIGLVRRGMRRWGSSQRWRCVLCIPLACRPDSRGARRNHDQCSVELRHHQHIYLGKAGKTMTAASQAPVAKWFLAALLAGLYVILLSHFGGLLYQDYPNHLARATVIADLLFHHGQHFGAAFQF